jgi:hypothetical protein
MYTSVVDLTTKQGKARELTQAVNDKFGRFWKSRLDS